MNTMALFWIIVFSCAALLFFVIAAVAGIRGLVDLRVLLRGSQRGDGPPSPE
jgi:hypothetical protein